MARITRLENKIITYTLDETAVLRRFLIDVSVITRSIKIYEAGLATISVHNWGSKTNQFMKEANSTVKKFIDFLKKAEKKMTLKGSAIHANIEVTVSAIEDFLEELNEVDAKNFIEFKASAQKFVNDYKSLMFDLKDSIDREIAVNEQIIELKKASQR